MDESAKDVTQRILDRHIIYGASDNTNPAYYSSSKSLNYGIGGTIQKPEIATISIIPYKLDYSDTVGLFGKENHFIKVNVQIDRRIAFACFEEDDWECGRVEDGDITNINTYVSAIIDDQQDPTTVNTYEPAFLADNTVPNKNDAFISVDLTNLKTGNKYIDAWFDVRLYTKAREEHPYDKMYVRMNDFFYIGFHARNTKRLPYNVNLVIGEEYISGLDTKQERYANRAQQLLLSSSSLEDGSGVGVGVGVGVGAGVEAGTAEAGLTAPPGGVTVMIFPPLMDGNT